MLFGYCIRSAGDSPPPDGLGWSADAAVFLVETPALGIWLSPAFTTPSRLEAIRFHDRVNREALRSATPVPLRFGTSLPDLAAAVALLEREHDVLLDKLVSVRGRVEMGLRVSRHAPLEPPSPPDVHPRVSADQPGPAGGREYLEAKKAEYDARDRRDHESRSILKVVDAAFRDIAESTVISAPSATDAEGIGSIAHLVPTDRLVAYRAAVVALLRSQTEFEVRVTGPWAPYSFV